MPALKIHETLKKTNVLFTLGPVVVSHAIVGHEQQRHHHRLRGQRLVHMSVEHRLGIVAVASVGQLETDTGTLLYKK